MLNSEKQLDLDNATTLEKILLCQKIGHFLKADPDDSERMVVEAIVQMLAVDYNEVVREKLSFELRNCEKLDPNVAEIIARDIQHVAQPFLAETLAFTDQELAALIPELQSFAHITLAKRKDIGRDSILALVTSADEEAVTYIIRNDDLFLPIQGYTTILDRFSDQQTMMNYLSKRKDIPLSLIDRLSSLISDAYRMVLIKHYQITDHIASELTANSSYDFIWDKIIQATDAQIHTYAIDLYQDGRLTPSLVCEIGGRGSYAFLVSAFSVLSGRTRAEVKGIMSLTNPKDFVVLLRECEFGDDHGPIILKVVKNLIANHQ